METKWLEDFLSLAETRSFSRSAQLRRITQPAFSRRIQALEAWAGADLVDRSSFPTRLTAAGETVHAQAIEILASLQYTINILKQHSTDSESVVEFAMPPALACSFFPQWMANGPAGGRAARTRVLNLSEHDAMLSLNEGTVDFMLAWHHALQPLPLGEDRFEMRVLAHERLVPVCTGAGKERREPKMRFGPATGAQAPVALLNYPSGSYLGRLVDHAIRQAAEPVHCSVEHEAELPEALAALAAHGLGVAFVPERFLEEREGLVRAGDEWSIPLEVRLYRERRDFARRHKRTADLFWAAVPVGA